MNQILKMQNYIKKSLTDKPPVKCDFKVGDDVIFTNPNGVKFKAEVIGFSSGAMFRYGHFIHIDTGKAEGAYWYPHEPECLQKIN